ncbi:hypothetical protein ACJ41O_007056 [Fusarium nematophilum]
MSSRLRNANPCDGCTFRRVKCEESKPCRECRLRGIECTNLRARKKRGPKGGPRSSTRARVEEFQRSIQEARSDSPARDRDIQDANSDRNDGSNSPLNPKSASLPEISAAESYSQLPPYRLPLTEYRRFIEIYRQQAYSIWPVINCDELLDRITQNSEDHESHALAAALCASTIAQLRLVEHTRPQNTTSSLQFTTECLYFRELYDYRETYTIASVLIPFFLHVYYANANKLRTAGFFLRESIMYVHALELGYPETYTHLGQWERSLRLRVYWLVLVTERTYSAQHNMPAVLQVIDASPDLGEDMGDGQFMQAFVSLTRLFAYLGGHLTAASRGQQPLERQKVVSYQADLCLDSHDHASHEAQRVDLFVTRQWIRLLLWEYTARHFAMSCYPEDQAFSLFLPVKIGHEMLSLFSMVTNAAVKAHGYGIELKVFRLADAMLDIVDCAPRSARGDGMLVGSGDILNSLQRVLLDVGGQNSVFLRNIQLRMSQLEMNTGSWPYLTLEAPVDETEAGEEGEKC